MRISVAAQQEKWLNTKALIEDIIQRVVYNICRHWEKNLKDLLEHPSILAPSTASLLFKSQGYSFTSCLEDSDKLLKGMAYRTQDNTALSRRKFSEIVVWQDLSNTTQEITRYIDLFFSYSFRWNYGYIPVSEIQALIEAYLLEHNWIKLAPDEVFYNNINHFPSLCFWDFSSVRWYQTIDLVSVHKIFSTKGEEEERNEILYRYRS